MIEKIYCYKCKRFTDHYIFESTNLEPVCLEEYDKNMFYLNDCLMKPPIVFAKGPTLD